MSEIENPIERASTSGINIPTDATSSGIQSSAEIIATINQFQARFAEMDGKFVNTEQKIERSGDKNIETLALFVGLFTFISIEFSLFKELKDFSQVVSLTLIIAGLLIFFILLLHIIVRTVSSKNKLTFLIYPILLLIAILLVVGGIYFPNSNLDKMPLKEKPTPTPTTMPTITPTPIPLTPTTRSPRSSTVSPLRPQPSQG